MEIKSKVSRNFVEMNVEKKLIFGGAVYSKINLIPPDPDSRNNPIVAAADLLTANNSLSTAANNYQLNPDLLEALLAEEKNWIKVYNKEADWLDLFAENDDTVIEAYGFHHTKTETTPTQKPEVVKNPDMYPAAHAKGGVHAEVEAQKGVAAYVFDVVAPEVVKTITGNQITYSLDGKVIASVIVDTHRSVDFQQLPSHTDMKGQITAVNRAGMSDPTSPSDVSVP